MKKLLLVPFALLIACGGAQKTEATEAPVAEATETVEAEAPAPAADIVDTAVAAGDFNTLVTAVQAAGLVDTLKGEGPFTVFAPTDEAFAKIPPETLEGLLADKEALTKVLTYHVVPGKVMDEYGFGDAAELIEAKKQGELSVLDDGARQAWLNRLDGLFELLDEARDPSPLPAEPPPAAAAELDRWLIETRRRQLAG